MAFSITGLRSFAWPDESQVSASLQPYDLALDELGAAIRSFTDDTDPGVNRYTEALAANLAKHLRAALKQPGLNPQIRRRDARYSGDLEHNADVVVWRANEQRGVFIEIEFRPNFEKDLVKFRIGHHSTRLDLGVLLVATDRRAIRGSYTTMPEFGKVCEVVRLFRPDHPLLVLGIECTTDGGHTITEHAHSGRRRYKYVED